MNNFNKTQKVLSEAKKPNMAMLLKKTLEGPDFGYTDKGGNGLVKKKGKNLFVYDGFFYGEENAIKQLKKAWSPGGHDYEYFKDEYGMEIKVVGTGSDFHSKLFGKNLGACWVELEVK